MIKFEKRKKVEINLIPMINIIFLLLIFFMLTGTIQKQLNPKIQRPESIFSTKNDNIDSRIINITLNEKGEIFIDNKLLSKNSFSLEIKKKNISSKVVLDVDKNSKLTDVNKVLKILKLNKFKKVFIKTNFINELSE